MALTIHVEPDHSPIEITAYLRSGVSLDLPYGLDLAGLLATRIRTVDRARLAHNGRLLTNPLPDTTEEDPEDLLLPLARCGDATTWHWVASTAILPRPIPAPDPRTYYRTVDTRLLHNAATRPLPYHHPSKGPYRDMMMPSPVIETPNITWRALGNAEDVYQLLHGIRFIGRRRSTGEGCVLRWNVTKTSPPDVEQWVHVDGQSLIRPVPPACAEALNVPYRLGWYAIRPPSWHPDRLTEMAMTEEDEDDGW